MDRLVGVAGDVLWIEIRTAPGWNARAEFDLGRLPRSKRRRRARFSNIFGRSFRLTERL
jgi:hypothetical protein